MVLVRCFFILVIVLSISACSALNVQKSSGSELHPGHPGHEVH
jgi:hypothetical protein